MRPLLRGEASTDDRTNIEAALTAQSLQLKASSSRASVAGFPTSEDDDTCGPSENYFAATPIVK